MATAVTIQIVVDSTQAQAALVGLETGLKQAGVTGEVSFNKVGSASVDATAKIQNAVAPASAFEAQMRQLGMSGAAAASGITNVGTASAAASTRMRAASGEMQQMIANMEAAHTRLATMKPPQAPSASRGQSFFGFNMGDAFADPKGFKAAKDMHELGEAFAINPSGIKAASEEVKNLGTHTATGLDAVRLLSQEFGLRLPRAIESMLARMPAVVGALGSMLGVMAGIAAAEVFVHLAEEGYRLYEQYISLNAVAEKFYDTLKKTAQEDFASTRSVATTKQRMDTATQNYATSGKASQGIQSSALVSFAQGDIAGGVAGLVGAHKIAEQGAQAGGDMVKLGKVQLDQTHAQALAQIELNHAMDSTLTGAQKINAEAAKKKEITAEGRAFDRKTEQYYGNAAPADAGAEEQRIKDQTADKEAAAQKTILGREAALATMKANDEAVQAGLEGDALYTRKRLDGIREITLQLQNQGKDAQQIAAETAAFTAKLDNEHADRLQKQWHDAQQAMRTASQSGLTGGARISADHDNEVQRINTDRSLSPEAAAQLRIAAQTTATQKMQALEDNFTDHVKQLEAQKTAASLNGFAKIDAEAQAQVDELNKRYRDDFQNAQLTATQKLEAERNLSAGISAIQDAAEAHRKQLRATNATEDLQYAQEASRAEARVREDGMLGWVAAYKNGIASINEEDLQRTAKMQEEAAKQGATMEEIAQRKTDIDRVANAQIAEQNQQMQHQIANDLQQAFTNPVEAIKNAMEKMFFEIVAGWIMRMDAFKSIFGTTMGGLQPGAPTGATGTGGLMNTILHGTGGAFAGHPSISGEYSPATSTTGIGGSSTVDSTVHASGSFASGMGARPFGGSASTLSTSNGGFGSVMSTASQVTSLGGLIPQAPVPGMGGVFAGNPSMASIDTGGLNLPYSASATPDDVAAHQAAHQAPLDDADAAGASGMASQAMNFAGAGMGAYTGAMATVNAFESDSPLKGAMGDAAAGAAIGSIIPGVGTAIGAGVGAAVGAAAGLLGMATGEGGKLSARNYYDKNVLPTFEQDLAHPEFTDFQSAIADANRTAGTALAYMKIHFGSDAANWVNDQYMSKELTKVTTMYSNAAEGGRQYTTLSASQFHTGGQIAGFGSFGTSSNEGFIHAMLGETVMNTQATSSHAPMLHAMNSGASAADIAGAYLAAAAPQAPAPSQQSDRQVHLHVHTLDTKTMKGWLKDGGGQLISKHLNDYTGQYAGDGNNG